MIDAQEPKYRLRDRIYRALDRRTEEASYVACYVMLWMFLWMFPVASTKNPPDWVVAVFMGPIMLLAATFGPLSALWWVLDYSRGYGWKPEPVKRKNKRNKMLI